MVKQVRKSGLTVTHVRIVDVENCQEVETVKMVGGPKQLAGRDTPIMSAHLAEHWFYYEAQRPPRPLYLGAAYVAGSVRCAAYMLDTSVVPPVYRFVRRVPRHEWQVPE